LIAAIAFAVLTVNAYRQGKIGNGDLMVRVGVFVVPLLLFSLDPAPLQWTFNELSFRKGGGHRQHPHHREKVVAAGGPAKPAG
jgi:hypothetical protein